MIRVRLHGEEREISYEEFIRAIQEGEITAETEVYSEVLTSSLWKPAGQLQFFRVWAPKGSLPPVPEPTYPESTGAPSQREGLPPSSARPAEESPSIPPPAADEIPPSSDGPTEEPPLRPAAPSEEFPLGEAGEGGSLPPTAPPEGPVPEPEDEHGDPIFWEMTDRIGLWPALVGTVALAFRRVDDFSARIRRTQVLVPALTFGLLVFAVSSVFQALYDAVLLSSLEGFFDQLASEFPDIMGEEMAPGTARDVFFTGGLKILFYPVLIAVWSGIVHLLLRIFGKPERGLAGTFRMANYAIAPLLLTIIPFCGNLIGLVWYIVLLIRGLSRVHRMDGVYTTLATLTPLVVFFCVYAASIFGGIMRSMSSFGGGLPS
jgi:hypothetical protein